MSASATLARGAEEHRAHWLDVVADPVRLQILRLLSCAEEATASELAAGSPASYQTLRRHLDALEASGVIRTRPGVSDGERTGRPAAHFSLNPEVRQSVSAAFGGASGQPVENHRH